MTRLIGFVLAALVFSGGAIHASPMHDDFAKLLERCRVAIEQSLPLDEAELKPVLVHEDHSRSWGTDTTQTGWALENSERYQTDPKYMMMGITWTYLESVWNP